MTMLSQIEEAPFPALEVRDLTVQFATPTGPATAVDRVSFSVMPGEVLGILGESGSGKSVTARATMGLLPGDTSRITAGEVLLQSERISGLSESQMVGIRGKRIAMIFQDPLSALNPVFQIGFQLTEVLRKAGMNRSQAHSEAIRQMERVGIPDPKRRLHAYPHQFSGGMRQRVMIAMALCQNPEILIADEPTTALDVTVQAQIMDLLRSLQRETGLAIILITHDLALLAEIADRVVVMYSGKVVETGSIEDVLDNPAHPYTLGLLTSRPDLERPRERLQAIVGSPPSITDRPAGCPFHPRCEFAIEQCRVVVPPLDVVRPGRRAACHRSDEVLHLTGGRK